MCHILDLPISFQERRETYIRQLLRTPQFLSRVKLKIFGHSGVGKTTLLDSLKCGYISSFFRRNRLTTATSLLGYGKGKGKYTT